MSATPAGPAATGLVCAFAVTRTPPDPAGLAAARHEEGGPLRVLSVGGLCLIVQDVPAALFDEAALAERLNRPDDLERCARAHHRASSASCPAVVPLPMATLYRGDLTAARALTARQPVLDTLLDRLRDRTEWAVKVHAAEAAPEAPGDPAPAPPPAPAAGDAPTSAGSAHGGASSRVHAGGRWPRRRPSTRHCGATPSPRRGTARASGFPAAGTPNCSTRPTW
ncbi:hypothetical protein SVIOM342S_07581 [Streptomyces violaceorubidus]